MKNIPIADPTALDGCFVILNNGGRASRRLQNWAHVILPPQRDDVIVSATCGSAGVLHAF